ncbi:hypothetical protein M0813_17219 [Anaeramoeba flamelloides]|uniref:Uncharacterized protein n=1 Tax=Anaeramoeba flamelloides TaxID=1746091 RepID=A0ABQ8YW25_9EUKA|nr:hypothetical protein M0813_17219 [Anaeramoeba flamelloides]
MSAITQQREKQNDNSYDSISNSFIHFEKEFLNQLIEQSDTYYSMLDQYEQKINITSQSNRIPQIISPKVEQVFVGRPTNSKPKKKSPTITLKKKKKVIKSNLSQKPLTKLYKTHSVKHNPTRKGLVHNFKNFTLIKNLKQENEKLENSNKKLMKLIKLQNKREQKNVHQIEKKKKRKKKKTKTKKKKKKKKKKRD